MGEGSASLEDVWLWSPAKEGGFWEEGQERCVLASAGVFPPYTWSAFALGQGKKISGDVCFLPKFELCHLGFPLCSCVLRVEPLCCEIQIVHAVEFFSEELGPRESFCLKALDLCLFLADNDSRNKWQRGLISLQLQTDPDPGAAPIEESNVKAQKRLSLF